MPKVSIILSVYNGAASIEWAIKSALNQSYGDWELIIIDDGSADNTQGLIKKFLNDKRIVYSKNEKNLGIHKSLNKGLYMACGEYIARIDHDDEWIDKDKLKKQTDFLDQNRDYVLIGTGVVVVDNNNKEVVRYFSPQTDEEIRRKILFKNCFASSGVMFRKKEAVLVGGYDESEREAEDYDLWLRLGKVGKFSNLPIFGIKYGINNRDFGNRVSKAKLLAQNIALIKKYKKDYPGYLFAAIFAHLRSIMYYFLWRFLPAGAQERIMKIYKSL